MSDTLSEINFTNWQSTIDKDDSKKYLISLGDNNLQNLNRMAAFFRDGKNYYISGDQDYDKNSLKPFLGQVDGYTPLNKKKYCPEPETLKINENATIVSINTNWFLDSNIQLLARSENCTTFNENDFYESLESILEDYQSEGHHIFLVMHHNSTSFTKRSGKAISNYNWIPVIGQSYISYKKHIGGKQDLTGELYERFVQKMNDILQKYDNICVITGHDYVSHIAEIGTNVSINVHSGSSSYRYSNEKGIKFISDHPEYLKITFDDHKASLRFSTMEKEIVLYSFLEDSLKESKELWKDKKIDAYLSDTILAANMKFHAGKFKSFIMGSGYRAEWTQNIQVPKTNIFTLNDGMVPYGFGGGKQTESIKLKAENHRRYAFRLLEKRPEKALSEFARHSLYNDITTDLITTMHPYGPLVADELLNQTDILHVSTVMLVHHSQNIDTNLYKYYEDKIAYLEEKPKSKSKKNPGFHGADEIYKTYEMLNGIRKGSQYKLDKIAYAKVRVMDMWLGDWDRHEDNWIWARFDTSDIHTLKPIPKDRDHVFSKWSGLLPKIADFAVPNAENFGFKFKDIRDLNFKARFLDRQLASELDKKDWLEAANYLIGIMTDSIIDQSVMQMPKDVYSFSGSIISEKLKSRRADLVRAVKVFYADLSKKVHIPGTNKRDYFEIISNDNSTVEIHIYDINKYGDREKMYYSRMFSTEETDAIYCFGLGDDDRFDVSGFGGESIKVYIIGGEGKDSIFTGSKNMLSSKCIQVYDSDNSDFVENPNLIGTNNPARPARYEPYTFDYNYLAPKPGFRNSSGNGFGYTLGLTYYVRGFNKPDFAEKWDFGAIYYPGLKAYRLDGKYQYKHFIGLSDLFIQSRFSTQYDKYPFFYGTGNHSTFDRKLRDEGYNRIDYGYIRTEIGLESTILRKSKWQSSLFIEYHNVNPARSENILPEIPLLAGIGKEQFCGLKSLLEVDFTDDLYYPTDGNKLVVNLEGRISESNKITGKVQTEASYYKSVNIGLKTTLIGRTAYQVALGDVNFYHLSSIGSNTIFRGYPRNRFTDKHSLVYNAEIRIEIPTFYTPLFPLSSGTFFFYDGGKVWNKLSDFSMEHWNNSYGFGFYVAPGTKQYTLTATIAFTENDMVYSKVNLGFDF
ncbi:MAG: hypothetical protein IPL55_10260 [Saprospiraceae bacterium]|nr:hypothetical protein [Saprospiraceae bacterium]